MPLAEVVPVRVQDHYRQCFELMDQQMTLAKVVNVMAHVTAPAIPQLMVQVMAQVMVRLMVYVMEHPSLGWAVKELTWAEVVRTWGKQTSACESEQGFQTEPTQWLVLEQSLS